MGSRVGVLKIAAKRAAVSLEQYLKHIANGNKYCYACKSWRPRAEFNMDKSRGDGLASRCTHCNRVKIRVSTKGRPSVFKGKHHTDEAKDIMSKKKKGKRFRLGTKHSIETRRRISEIVRQRAMRGKLCHSYKDGRVAERRGVRYSTAYKRWRFDVFSRDGFTCQQCGNKKGGNLNAHHIKPFADFPDLRLLIENGITLCEGCHKKEHEAV